MINPYEIMGVKINATESQLKKAFHKLARECHPDSDPNNPWANDEFKTLSAAYELLSDPKRRALYDRGEISGDGTKRTPKRTTKSRAKSPSRSPHKRKRTATSPKGSPKKEHTKTIDLNIKGTNVEYSLKIDFFEAVRGGEQQILLANGKRLKVNIPPNAEDGLILRLKGQGLKGLGSGKDGNAYVEISINPDPIFRRENNDVHVDTQVTLDEAVLGGKIDVPTIDGKVSVQIPKNSNTGTQLRLKGKGLGTQKRGDQYVHLNVILPNKTDKEFINFIKDWSLAHPYKVDR